MTKTGNCSYDGDYQLVSPSEAAAAAASAETESQQEPKQQLLLIETSQQQVSDNEYDNDDPKGESVSPAPAGTPRQVGGAAAAGGLLGLIVAGPIGGVVGAGGAAVLAANAAKGNKAGDVARASGEAMATAGDRIKAWNEQHRVTEKTAKAFSKTGKSLKELDDKHKVTETTTNGVLHVCDWITNKLKNAKNKNNNKQQQTPSADARTTDY